MMDEGFSYMRFCDIEEESFEGGRMILTEINHRPVYFYKDKHGLHGVWYTGYPKSREEKKDFAETDFKRLMDVAFAWAYNLGSDDDKAIWEFHKWHQDAWDEPISDSTAFTRGKSIAMNLAHSAGRTGYGPWKDYWLHILATVFYNEGNLNAAETVWIALGEGHTLSPQ